MKYMYVGMSFYSNDMLNVLIFVLGTSGGPIPQKDP